MSDELKPCPFCFGSDGEHDSECFLSKRWGDISIADWERYWNTRPIEDELQRKLDELQKENDELRKHQIPQGWICHP